VGGDRFVQLLPDELDELAVAYGLDFDERALLMELVMLADWQTATASVTVSALASHLGAGRKRVSSAIAGLARRGLVAARVVRGHEGSIEVLVYDRVVRGARVGAHMRPAETPPLESERTSDLGERDGGVAAGSYGSERTSARVGAHMASAERRERPAETAPRCVDVVDPPSPPPASGTAGAARRALEMHVAGLVRAEGDPAIRDPAAIARARVDRGAYTAEQAELDDLERRRPDLDPIELLDAWNAERGAARDARRTCVRCGGRGVEELDLPGNFARPCPVCSPVGATA
jgi:hypothetical protein